METLPPQKEPLPGVEPPVKEQHTFDTIWSYVALLTRVFTWVAGAGLVGMLVLVVADIIGIKLLSRPVPGGIEIVAFLAVIAIGFAIPFTQMIHGHVAVDFVVERFPRRVRLVIESVTVFLSVVVMGLLAWYSFKYAALLRNSGEVSMTQNIPFYPFVYALAVCFALTAVVLILEFVQAVRKVGGKWTR